MFCPNVCEYQEHTCICIVFKAAELLVNLTSQPMPEDGNIENAENIWQGPIVRNEQTQARSA